MKRRKDLETQFRRQFHPGLMAWNILGSVWFVANPLNPGFWHHIWTMWKGKRLWAIRWYFRHPLWKWADKADFA